MTPWSWGWEGIIRGNNSRYAYNGAFQIIQRTLSNDAYAQSFAVGGQINLANGLNQFTPGRGVGFAYDGRGNMSSDGVNAYGYDILNRLIARGSATLGYDPAGRLYQSVAAGVTTRMLYDGAAMIGEYNGSNALQRRFVHGPGMDEPLVWYEGAGTSDRRWLIADERGSIVAVTNAAGAATNINSYDEYGVPGASNVGRFQYTGQMWLSEVGVYHYKTRAYAPALGRFLQTDPIGTAGGVNLYAYVGGDPANFTDPWGLEKEDKPITVTGTRCSADPACLLRLQQQAERAAGQQWVRDMQEQFGRRTDDLAPTDADEGENREECEALTQQILDIGLTLNGPMGINYQIDKLTAVMMIVNRVTFAGAGFDILANDRAVQSIESQIQAGRSEDALREVRGLSGSLWRGGGATFGAAMMNGLFGSALTQFQSARNVLVGQQAHLAGQRDGLGC